MKRTWADQGINYTATYAWSRLGLSGYSNNGVDEPTQTSSVTSWIVRDPSGVPIAQRYRRLMHNEVVNRRVRAD